jgi:hypothetical protein
MNDVAGEKDDSNILPEMSALADENDDLFSFL